MYDSEWFDPYEQWEEPTELMLCLNEAEQILRGLGFDDLATDVIEIASIADRRVTFGYRPDPKPLVHATKVIKKKDKKKGKKGSTVAPVAAINHKPNIELMKAKEKKSCQG